MANLSRRFFDSHVTPTTATANVAWPPAQTYARCARRIVRGLHSLLKKGRENVPMRLKGCCRQPFWAVRWAHSLCPFPSFAPAILLTDRSVHVSFVSLISRGRTGYESRLAANNGLPYASRLLRPRNGGRFQDKTLRDFGCTVKSAGNPLARTGGTLERKWQRFGKNAYPKGRGLQRSKGGSPRMSPSRERNAYDLTQGAPVERKRSGGRLR